MTALVGRWVCWVFGSLLLCLVACLVGVGGGTGREKRAKQCKQRQRFSCLCACRFFFCVCALLVPFWRLHLLGSPGPEKDGPQGIAPDAWDAKGLNHLHPAAMRSRADAVNSVHIACRVKRLMSSPRGEHMFFLREESLTGSGVAAVRGFGSLVDHGRTA